ncbi:MAG TPA: LppX_LprAFG lipoprotein [Ktedonobacteraceae bacterium]|nr:LppX_LprAFG lipoprotein [Ktedonobacteraceae bacterium]
MKTYKISSIFIGLALAIILLVVSACSAPGTTGSSNSSSLTVMQVLQNSAKAMQNLKSVHFNTTTKASFQGSSSSSASSPGAITVNLKATGDQQSPNEQAQISLNNMMNIAEVVTADKVYVQNTQGKWYVLNKSDLKGQSGDLLNGSNLFNMNTLMSILEQVKLTDHGDQMLNGQSLRHITATLDKNALQQILTTNSQLSNAIGKQNIDKILNSTRSFNSTLDLWIDETHFYVHRTELKVNANADLSSLATPDTQNGVKLPSNATITLDTIVDLSNFNTPVTITPPANATPTNNPGVIFGMD